MMEKTMICPTCGHEMDLKEVAAIEPVGMRFRAVRQSAGLNQVDMCSKARIATNTLCSLELRDVLPSLASAIRMARAVGVSLDILFGNLEDDGSEDERE